MDLLSYAKHKFHHDGTDWKRDTETAYRRWMRRPTDARRDDIVRAIAPGVYYVSYRYTNHGVTRAEAFDVGICHIATSLENFHPDKSPRGISAVSSYLLWGAELAMMSYAKEGLEHADMECSLDEYEDYSWIGATHDIHDARTPVADVVSGAITAMPPSDGRIAQWRLIDELTWDEVISHASAAGDRRCSTRWGIITHFNTSVRPRIADALRRAGYDETDI